MIASLPSVSTRAPGTVAQVAHDLPVADLLREIDAQPGIWHERTLRQDFPGSPHADTRCIMLRAPADLHDVAASFHDLDPVDYPEYDRLPSARKLVGQIAALVGAQRIGRVMVAALMPGGVIAEHVDEGAYADRFDRFHCALVTDPGAKLIVNDEYRHVEAGELVWFNHKLRHAAVNDCDYPRLHLIVDAVAPTWRTLRGGPFQREAIHGLWEEVMPLLRAHKAEIAHYQDIELAPDFAAYERMEEAGALRVYTARDEAGRLVGYSAHFVRPNLHYSKSLQAQQDVLFLLPEYRHGGLGLRLIQYADECLRADGVEVSMQHVKARPDLDFGPLLKRLGYEHVDQIYCRRLN